MQTDYTLAGIDVHKRILVVAVAYPGAELQYETERFSTTPSALTQLAQWLQQRHVREVVLESTAQYWQPVWRALEGHFELHLAQAKSNPAPHGRKTDVEDAKRLVRRLHARELRLSFVPNVQQRLLRSLMRARYQLTCDHVRTQAQVESLLEEASIKLSSFLSDLFGTSGRRILRALAMLPREEIQSMLDDDGEARANCEFCHAAYVVSGDQLRALLQDAGVHRLH